MEKIFGRICCLSQNSRQFYIALKEKTFAEMIRCENILHCLVNVDSVQFFCSLKQLLTCSLQNIVSGFFSVKYFSNKRIRTWIKYCNLSDGEVHSTHFNDSLLYFMRLVYARLLFIRRKGWIFLFFVFQWKLDNFYTSR